MDEKLFTAEEETAIAMLLLTMWQVERLKDGLSARGPESEYKEWLKMWMGMAEFNETVLKAMNLSPFSGV